MNKRSSSLLSVLLTILIIYLLLKSGIIYNLILFVVILIALIIGGLFINSLFYNNKKPETIKPQKENDNPIIINKLQTYYAKNKILPISDNASLMMNNFFYSNISDLCIAYKDEKITKLSDIKENNYSLYEKIIKKLETYSMMNDDEILNLSKNIKLSDTNVKRKEININNINGSMVNKPEVNEINIKDDYKEYILEVINNVNYGEDNSKEYVSGHIKALNKYFEEIVKSKNLIETSINLDNEINSIKDKTSIFDKGYYDGLFYCMKTIKLAKKAYLEVIEKEI